MPIEFSRIKLREIGIIHTKFKGDVRAPIQPYFNKDDRATVEIFSEFADGLADLEGFSHIYLIYYLDRAKEPKMKVVPYLDSEKHGVFATRSPNRPNPIGMSIVRLIAIDDNILTISGVDILDDTPLLDIKPYVDKFDNPVFRDEKISIGWLEGRIQHPN